MRLNPDSRAWTRAGIALWAIPLGVISVLVARHPAAHSVMPVYHDAAARWWARTDLYGGPDYHYLPHFAILFSPFHALPAAVGDVVWRWLSTGLLAGALWQWVGRDQLAGAPRRFFWASLIGFTLCLPAIRNGQANVLFGALLAHAALRLGRAEWWRALGLLLLAMMIKPLAIVMLLLAGVVYRPLIGRAVVGFVALAGFPFLFGPPAYVLAECRAALVHLGEVSLVTEHRFADLNGLFRTLGHPLTGRWSQMVRAGAGAATLALWWRAASRLREPRRAELLLALSTTYLMVFNPMTELNSYVILAPVLAAYALRFLAEPARRAAGWFLVFALVSMGLGPELFRPWDPQFALWWFPVMALGAMTTILASERGAPTGWPGTPGPEETGR